MNATRLHGKSTQTYKKIKNNGIVKEQGDNQWDETTWSQTRALGVKSARSRKLVSFCAFYNIFLESFINSQTSATVVETKRYAKRSTLVNHTASWPLNNIMLLFLNLQIGTRLTFLFSLIYKSTISIKHCVCSSAYTPGYIRGIYI